MKTRAILFAMGLILAGYVFAFIQVPQVHALGEKCYTNGTLPCSSGTCYASSGVQGTCTNLNVSGGGACGANNLCSTGYSCESGLCMRHDIGLGGGCGVLFGRYCSTGLTCNGAFAGYCVPSSSPLGGTCKSDGSITCSQGTCQVSGSGIVGTCVNNNASYGSVCGASTNNICGAGLTCKVPLDSVIIGYPIGGGMINASGICRYSDGQTCTNASQCSGGYCNFGMSNQGICSSSQETFLPCVSSSCTSWSACGDSIAGSGYQQCTSLPYCRSPVIQACSNTTNSTNNNIPACTQSDCLSWSECYSAGYKQCQSLPLTCMSRVPIQVACNYTPPVAVSPIGGSCGSGVSCSAGLTCNSGICQNTNVGIGSTCDSNNLCSSGLTCNSGVYVSAAFPSESVCQQTNVAAGGTCSTNQICSSGLTCNSGICASVNASNNSSLSLPVSGVYVSSYGQGYITWSWSNPSDSEFNQSIIYLDGSNVLNTTYTSFTASNLAAGTTHTITILTQSKSGVINPNGVSYAYTTESQSSSSTSSSGSSGSSGTIYTSSNNVNSYPAYYSGPSSSQSTIQTSSSSQPEVLNSAAGEAYSGGSNMLLISSLIIGIAALSIILIVYKRGFGKRVKSV